MQAITVSQNSCPVIETYQKYCIINIIKHLSNRQILNPFEKNNLTIKELTTMTVLTTPVNLYHYHTPNAFLILTFRSQSSSKTLSLYH